MVYPMKTVLSIGALASVVLVASATATPDVSAAITQLTCNGVPTRLQFMHLQDLTSTFADDLPNIQEQLPQLFNVIKQVSDKSLFGLMHFLDRGRTDACVTLDRKLNRNLEETEDKMSSWSIGFGGDEYQDSWSAASYATQMAGWQDPLAKYRDTKIISISTDALPHYDKHVRPQFPNWNHWDEVEHGDFEYNDVINCSSNYPDFETVADLIVRNDMYLLLFISGVNDESDGGLNTEHWKELIKSKSPKLIERTVIVPANNDSSNFLDGMLDGITQINCIVAPSFHGMQPLTVSDEFVSEGLRDKPRLFTCEGSCHCHHSNQCDFTRK